MKGSRKHLEQSFPHHFMGESAQKTMKSRWVPKDLAISLGPRSNFQSNFNTSWSDLCLTFSRCLLTVTSNVYRRHEGRTWHGNQTSIRKRRNQPGCVHTQEVLTVQVTVPDALDVLGVDEVVASLPHNVYRGQIHIITDPTMRRTQNGIQKGENIETVKWLRNICPGSFHYTRVSGRTWHFKE